MTDKEFIKQEIERRFNDNMKASEQFTENSKSRALFASAAKEDYDLLAFIDSLTEEPTIDDLEIEIENYINSNFSEGCDGGMLSDSEPNLGGVTYCDLANLARHFAEWQKQKDLEDSLKSDLTMPNKFYEKGKADAMKEMMKDAVDATIFSELKGSDGSLFQAKTDRFKMNGVKIGDTIKVIPIKIEQQ